MLMPQGFIVQKREFEELKRKVDELERKLAELEAKEPEKRKLFRREVVNG
jgi:polyhydroxyalkanoate synthesis regulator phasin